MIEFTISEKLIVLAILISIMEADCIIDPNEIKYLDKIIQEFGLNQNQLDLLSDTDFNGIVEIFKQFDKQKKEYAIQLFKEMASCDGYVDPREISIINKF